MKNRIFTLILSIVLVLAMCVPALAQRRSGGMGRSGGTSSVTRSYSPPRQSYSPPVRSYQSAPPQRQLGTGGMGRVGGTSTTTRPYNPAAPAQSAPLTTRSSAPSTAITTRSSYHYSAPVYVAPRYHYSIGYHYSVIPTYRRTIWYNGGWAYYYPDSGLIAMLSAPLVTVGTYNPNVVYAPPANQVPPDYVDPNAQTTTTTTTTNSNTGTATTVQTTRQPSGGIGFFGVLLGLAVLGVVLWLVAKAFGPRNIV